MSPPSTSSPKGPFLKPAQDINDAHIGERKNEDKWTAGEALIDSTVGRISLKFTHRVNGGERVPVKWYEGWYTASLKIFNDSPRRIHHAVKKLEDRYNKAPNIILMYVDRNEHAYSAYQTPSKQHVIICDEDWDNLDVYRTIPSQVGGAGDLILRGDESIVDLALDHPSTGMFLRLFTLSTKS